MKQGEPFSETKKRLSVRTGIKGKNFERIKFGVVRRLQTGKLEYLQDGEWSLRGSSLHIVLI